MDKKLYTVAEISRLTGYNRSTITRWLEKQKIKNAQMRGNAPLYTAQVLSEFKKTHSDKISKGNKENDLIAEKDARIKNLEDEIDLLKDQLQIKDDQITALTSVTKQAQSLNLADKDLNKLKKIKDLQSPIDEKESEPEKKPWYKHIFHN